MNNLLLVEAAERGQTGLKALGLVSRADEPLGEPGRTEYRLDLGEIRLRPVAFAPQVIPDRFVKGKPVRHLRGRERRDLKHVLEPVEERAPLIVVDRFIRNGQDVVDAVRRQRGVGLAGRLLESLQLLRDLQPCAEPRGLAAKRLGDEAARARRALVAVVDRAREIEGVFRAGHGDVSEPALLRDVTLPVRWRRACQRVG